MTQTSSDLNFSHTPHPPSPSEIFQTPWQNKLGKRERLCLIRKADGSVRAQILTQSIFKRISNFFEKKFSPHARHSTSKKNKFHVLEEKNFSNISEERFGQEKEHIGKLLKKHTSIKALLAQIEADFQTPVDKSTPHTSSDRELSENLFDFSYDSNQDQQLEEIEEDFGFTSQKMLTPKELEERHQQIANLRTQLETLMEKINEEEASRQIYNYEKLQSSIQKIKETALKTFIRLNKLEEEAKNPTISSSTINEAVEEIKSFHHKWNEDIASIRQILVEEANLQKEIESFTQSIRLFSPAAASDWESLLNEEQSLISRPSSLSDVQQRKQHIHKMMSTVCTHCKQELSETIEKANHYLENEENLLLIPIEEGKRKAVQNIHKIIFRLRFDVWNTFSESLSKIDREISELVALKNQLHEEQANDSNLIAILNSPLSQERYINKLFSLAKMPLTLITTPLKPFLPEFFNSKNNPKVLLEQQFFDETLLAYIDLTLKNIQDATREVLRLVEISNPSEPLLLQRSLLEETHLKKSELDEWIDNLQSSTRNLALKDEENREKLLAAGNNLQHFYHSLSYLLESQNEHRRAFAEATKAAHAQAFSASTAPSILHLAQTTLKTVFPTESDVDIMTLKQEWKTARDSAVVPLKTLQTLNQLANIHQEYEDIALWTEREIRNFTGVEKTEAENALDNLKKVINTLDFKENEIPTHASVASYKVNLLQANSSLDHLFKIEREKAELRKSVSFEIRKFVTEVKEMKIQAQELGSFYDINLNNVENTLSKTIQDIEEWNTSGQLPTSYVSYAPKSTLGSILYYAASFLPVSNPSVKDLNVKELNLYLERVKAEIEIKRKALSYTYVTRAYKTFKEFEEEVKEAEVQIKYLTSGVNQSSIPQNLSESDLPKLQFYNAAITKNKLQTIQNEQRGVITSNPDLKAIQRQLTRDIYSIKSALAQSRTKTHLTLLEQIKQLQFNPPQQRLAKLAFIEMLTTKMSHHTTLMTSQGRSLESIPKIYNAAFKLIEKTKDEMERNLKDRSHPLRSHSASWKVIRNFKTPSEAFLTNPNLPIDSISVEDLRSYASLVDFTIKTGADHMNLMTETYKKIKKANSLLDEKISEVNIQLNILDKKNQLISKAELENAALIAKRSLEQFSNTSLATKAPGWLDHLSLLVTPTQNLPAKQVSLNLFNDYQKHVGETIAKLEAIQKKISLLPLRSIPQQIALQPHSKITEELRKRFFNEYLPLIEDAKEQLQQYLKDGNLFKSYARYIPLKSALFQKIQYTAEKKLKELEEYETGYNTSLLPFTANTPLSDLTPDQMEKYAKKLTDIQSALTDELNQKFFIEKIVIAQAQYKQASTQKAAKLVEILRKKFNLLEANRFKEQLYAITSLEETTWKDKVRNASQIPHLIKDLKSYTIKIQNLIEEFESKRDPKPLEEQIRELLAYKAKLQSSSYLSYFRETPQRNLETIKCINDDIKQLQAKLHEFVEIERDEHRKKLEKAKDDVKELFSAYNISLASQKDVIHTIEHQLTKFSRLGTRFPVPLVPFSGFRTPISLPQWMTSKMKTIEEMTPEEILIIKAEKGITDLITESDKEITKVFNFFPLTEARNAYQETLLSAEKTLLELEANGQMSHAAMLKNTMNTISNELTPQQSAIKSKDDLEKLTLSLEEKTSRLRIEEKTAKNKPKLSPIEQVSLLRMNPPYLKKLEDFLRKDIEKTIEVQTEQAEHYSMYLDQLVKKVKFPKKWQEKIEAELNDSKAKLEKNSSITTTSWGFQSTQTLYQLSIDGLVQIHNNLKNESQNLTRILEKYRLNLIKEQFERYESQLKIARNLKAKWLSENHIDSVDKLDQLIVSMTERFTTYFAKQENESFSEKTTEQFYAEFKSILREFSKEISHIEKEKPATIGALLQQLDTSSDRYMELRSSLHREMEMKISGQQKVLNNYLSKLTTIENHIAAIFGHSVQLPDEWRLLLKNKVIYKQEQLKELSKGLPMISKEGNTWIRFEDLDAKQLLEYETLITQITEKDEKWTTSPNSILGSLEARLHLKELEKYLDLAKRSIKLLEPAIDKTPSLEKQKILNTILEANKQLLFHTFNNLKTIQDIHPLINTIRFAKANILLAYEQKGFPIESIQLDPWSLLHFNEKNTKKKFPDRDPLSEISEKGYATAYSSYDDVDNIQDKSHTEPHLKEVIEISIDNLNNIKTDFETYFSELLSRKLDPESTIGKAASTFLTSTLPQLQQELEDLNLGLPIKNSRDIHVVIKPSDIKTFEHLLQYRTLIYNTISKVKDVFAEQMDEKDFFWCAQALSKKATQNVLLIEEGEIEIEVEDEPIQQPTTPPKKEEPKPKVVPVPPHTQHHGSQSLPTFNFPATQPTPSHSTLPDQGQFLEELKELINTIQADLKLGTNLRTLPLNLTGDHLLNQIKASKKEHLIKTYEKFKEIIKDKWNKRKISPNDTLLEEIKNNLKNEFLNQQQTPSNQITEIGTNLILSFENIQHNLNESIKKKDKDNICINDIITDFEKLFYTQTTLKEINNIAQNIVNLHKQASDWTGKGHHSLYISPTILQSWDDQVSSLTLSQNLEELKSNKHQIEQLLSEIETACNKAQTLENKKTEINQTLENARKYITDELKFLPQLSKKLSSLIDQLKLNYIYKGQTRKISELTLEDFPNYQSYVEEIIRSQITQLQEEPTQPAIENYSQTVQKIKETINDLHKRKSFIAANQLNQILTSEENKIEHLSLSFKDSNLPTFKIALDEANARLTGTLIKALEDEKTSPTSLSEQLSRIPEKDEEFKIIRKDILENLKKSHEAISLDLKPLKNFLSEPLGMINNQQIQFNKDLAKKWTEELESIVTLLAPYKTEVEQQVRRGFLLSKISIKTDQLTKSELFDYDQQTQAHFKLARTKIEALQSICNTIKQLDLDDIHNTASQAIESLKKFKKPSYPYFFIDSLEKALENLMNAQNQLLLVMSKQDSTLEHLSYQADQFKQSLQQYNKTFESIKTETRDYTESKGLLFQLKANETTPDILKLESFNAIFDTIKKQAETHLNCGLEKLENYTQLTSTLPEELKEIFSKHIQSKKTLLKTYAKEMAELEKRRTSEVRSWFNTLRTDSKNVIIDLEGLYKLESRKQKFDKYHNLNQETGKLANKLKAENASKAEALDVKKMKLERKLKELLKSLKESKITLDAFWTSFDELYSTLFLYVSQANSKESSTHTKEFSSFTDLLMHVLQDSNFLRGGNFTEEDKCYKILGLNKTATKEEIKTAYRKCALKYHPDIIKRKDGESNEELEKRKKEANEKFIEFTKMVDKLIESK